MKLRTSTRDLTILHEMSPRYAKYTRKLDIELYIDLPEELTARPFSDATRIRIPCIHDKHCRSRRFSLLVQTLQRAPKLEHLVIRGPETSTPPTQKMRDDLLFSLDFEKLLFASQSVGLESRPLAHFDVTGLDSSRTILHAIMVALAVADINLNNFEMLGFTVFSYHTLLVPTNSLFHSLAISTSMRKLTTLTLELDIFRSNGKEATTALVRVLRNNANLKDLKVNLQPVRGAVVSSKESLDACAPVLKCLAENPPFRLRSLHLTGLCTVAKWTLDSIIRTHSSDLHTLVLKDTDFDHPNSLRAFFGSLTQANLEFLDLQEFWIEGNEPLETRFSTDALRKIVWTGKSRWTLRIGITFDIDAASYIQDGLYLDCRGAANGKERMKQELRCIVEQIDCGALLDI